MQDILESVLFRHVKSKRQENENKLFEMEDALKERLNKEEISLFIECMDERAEYFALCSSDIFKQGFWMGCEFMREVLD